jgi:ArsR family metal-binding transcriptional regulator
MASENTALSVLNGYSLDTILPCVADHEKIRVIVKIGARLTGQVFSTPGGLKR